VHCDTKKLPGGDTVPVGQYMHSAPPLHATTQLFCGHRPAQCCGGAHARAKPSKAKSSRNANIVLASTLTASLLLLLLLKLLLLSCLVAWLLADVNTDAA